MRTRTPTAAGQLGFDTLLVQAEQANAAQRFERETGHLPTGLDEAIPLCRDLIERHHAAMLAARVDEALSLREEAHRLALRLNGGAPGILAHANAPGCVLARETAAAPGTVPLWGQSGAFILALDEMRVRIELDGFFGLGGRYCLWPGFSAHAVDWDRLFLSETGFRSFLGIHAEPVPGLTPDAFAREVIAAHVARHLNGRLLAIGEPYRQRAEGAP